MTDGTERSQRIELRCGEIVGLRAANPGPFTLEGTNTWILGRQPAWLIDPGPPLAQHLEAVTAELRARGGPGAILLTHSHGDHAGALGAIRAHFPHAPVAMGLPAGPAAGGVRAGTVPAGDERRPGDLVLAHGARVGPLRAFATPGHASDHFAFIAGDVAFTGDAVLGVGSVFIAPEPGALRSYLEALMALRNEPLELICPGHGPVVEKPAEKLEEYIAHRRSRERALLVALAEGRRTVAELLASAWADVPRELLPAAAVTLAAHLDKLDEEGRLPAGVERPRAWRELLHGAAAP